jgi:hypothetical protein
MTGEERWALRSGQVKKVGASLRVDTLKKPGASLRTGSAAG